MARKTAAQRAAEEAEAAVAADQEQAAEVIDPWPEPNPEPPPGGWDAYDQADHQTEET